MYQCACLEICEYISMCVNTYMKIFISVRVHLHTGGAGQMILRQMYCNDIVFVSNQIC